MQTQLEVQAATKISVPYGSKIIAAKQIIKGNSGLIVNG
jgi:hypothetical protein